MKISKNKIIIFIITIAFAVLLFVNLILNIKILRLNKDIKDDVYDIKWDVSSVGSQVNKLNVFIKDIQDDINDIKYDVDDINDKL
ncbi:MAG: hypothetical protein J6S67_12315 [Methanobrevibacter sp.]|nr:hypothetical protein [Methanobrevibacter sp.]